MSFSRRLEKKDTPFQVCLGSGEGGSLSSYGAEEPILLAPGTTVKEALLIIRFRLDAKGDLDSM